MNLLLLSILLPLIGAGAVSCVPKVFKSVRRASALLASGAGVLLMVAVAATFSASTPAAQFTWKRVLNAEAGIALSLGIDGISLGFALVSALLCFVSLMASSPPEAVTEPPFPSSDAPLLLAQSALAGVYCMRDAILFWCFWALFVLASFLLVGTSGGSRRLVATSRVAFSGFASLVLFLGLILYLGGQTYSLGGRFDFSFEILSRVLLPLQSQYVALSVALVALALSLPLVPLSGWWNDTHANASSAACAMFLLGPALYAFIKIVVPCFPLAAFNLMPVVAGLCVIGAAIAAVSSFFETDLRRRIAWMGCTQVSIAVVGLSSLCAQGLIGAMLMSAVTAISLGGLLLSLGNHSQQASAATAPVGFLSKAFVAGAASIPGLGGFTATFVAIAAVSASDRSNMLAGLPRPAFDIEPMWLIVGSVFCMLSSSAALFAAMRGAVATVGANRLGYKSVPLWGLICLLVLLGVRPQPWVSLLMSTSDRYIEDLQARIVHARRAPDAPTHLFPNARSLRFAALSNQDSKP
jgi:NADH-quinone oxidoreductase subunit M